MDGGMSKKNGRDNKRPTLPDEVRRLITRKLRYQRHEQEKLLVSVKQAVYSKFHEEVLTNIRIQNHDQIIQRELKIMTPTPEKISTAPSTTPPFNALSRNST